MFSWVMDFLIETLLVGVELSSQYINQNSTPQACVVSPTLFSIMIYTQIFQAVCGLGFSRNLTCTAAVYRFLKLFFPMLGPSLLSNMGSISRAP